MPTQLLRRGHLLPNEDAGHERHQRHERRLNISVKLLIEREQHDRVHDRGDCSAQECGFLRVHAASSVFSCESSFSSSICRYASANTSNTSTVISSAGTHRASHDKNPLCGARRASISAAS